MLLVPGRIQRVDRSLSLTAHISSWRTIVVGGRVRASRALRSAEYFPRTHHSFRCWAAALLYPVRGRLATFRSHHCFKNTKKTRIVVYCGVCPHGNLDYPSMNSITWFFSDVFILGGIVSTILYVDLLTFFATVSRSCIKSNLDYTIQSLVARILDRPLLSSGQHSGTVAARQSGPCASSCRAEVHIQLNDSF